MILQQAAKQFLEVLGGSVYIGTRFHGINYAAEALENQSNWDYLDKLNKAGNDIYFCPNVLGTLLNHKNNLRHNKNVIQYRALFVEFDANHHQANQFPVPPNFIFTRRGKPNTNYHAYWLIQPTDDTAKWRTVTQWLIQFYQSDAAVKDPCRLMRLPDFLHVKDPTNPDIYDVTLANWQNRYTLDDIAAFHGMPVGWTPPRLSHEDAEDIDEANLDTPSYVAKYAAYLDSLGEVVEDRNTKVFTLALKGKRLGISYDKAFEMAFDCYVQNFAPFEDDNEFTVAFDKGYHNTTESAVGTETYHHAFRNAPVFELPNEATAPKPPAPPPPPPKTEDICNIDIPISRLIKQAPMGEFPTNDTLAAAIVLQCLRNPVNGGFEIVSTNDNLYVYRDRIWQIVREGELRRIITFLSVEAAKNGEGSKPLGGEKIAGTIRQMQAFTYEQALSDKQGICKFLPDGTVLERFDIIPMQNGLLDITNDELMPHSKAYFYTNTLPFAYEPEAECPNWIDWLSNVFSDDQEQIMRLQEWFGLNLTRDTSFQRFALLKGSPRSGKGTTLKVLQHLVGKNNYCGAELHQLVSDPTLLKMSEVQTCTMGDVHTIVGTDQNRILGKIKAITGEDEQTINRKYLPAITTTIPAKITMGCNDVPQFFDESGAFASRILLFVYRKGHNSNEIDTGLFERLIQEEKGIFNWALEGLRRLYKNGRFTESSIAEEYMQAIREDTQPTLVFIEQCLNITGVSRDRVAAPKMYDVYKRWCFANEKKPLSNSAFGAKLQSASGEQISRSRGRAGNHNGAIFVGCTINESAIPSSFDSNVIPMPQQTGDSR